MVRFIGLVVIAAIPAAAGSFPALTLTLGGGYTGYRAADLDRVNRILEDTYRSIDSTNQYTVYRFDGQAALSLRAGLEQGLWYLGLETTVWRELFTQHDLSLAVMGITGQLDVKQEFWFLPTALTAGYGFRFRRFAIRPRYGLGALLGRAAVNLVSQLDNRDDDALSFNLDSGLTPVQTFSCDIACPVRPWLGVGVSAGYRLAKIRYFKVAKIDGSSYLFGMLFDPSLQAGDRLYFGYDTLRFVQEDEVKPGYRLVTGDLSGFYLSGQITVSWPGGSHD